MLPPPGAIFEADLGNGVALYDVSHLLPVNDRRQYDTRSEAGIRRVYVHKSGGIGRGGFAGMLGSARYSVKDKTKRGRLRRGWPGFAYTFWVSRKPDIDQYGRLVVYRGNADDIRSWHTGGRCNDHGVGVAIQGNPSLMPLTRKQKRCLRALLDWTLGAYPLDDLTPVSTHSRARSFGAKKSKKICPGRFAEKWLSRWLDTNVGGAHGSRSR